MVFNSVQFLLFFVVVYGLYRALPHRLQNWLLLVASYWFYAAWDWRFLGLLAASTLIDFAVALAIRRRDDPRARFRLLWVSIAFNMGMLGFFKYAGFFAESMQALLGSAGLDVSLPVLRVVLPVGISFYTFMTMSYVVDVYRREVEPTRDLLDFAVFVAYFPHLVAGPILRAAVLIPQIAAPRRITRRQLVEGAWLTGWGLFKKIFVADNLGPIVDAIFAADAAPSAPAVILGCYAFAFQIYCDFSGYTDIARGVSALMGIELNINFRFPYFVRSPQAFWRHWHISLSTWLRDYLYIPLGGSRGSEWATSRNLMVTMLLGGLWHGAAWTFVLWGAYHGLLLSLYREGARWLARARVGVAWLEHPAVRVGGWLLMFHLTCYGWLLFRARSAEQIGAMTASLVTGWTRPWPDLGAQASAAAFYVLPLLVVHAWEAWRDDLRAVLALPMPVRYAIYVALAYFTLLFGNFGGTQFIYFQF